MGLQDFIAIDFETANGQRSSVCSVGLVVVERGVLTNELYSLIHPNPNYYTYWCTQVHGLTRADTDDAPYFPEVWQELSRHLPTGLPFVAHNAPFDEGCLRAAFQCYDMAYPTAYRFLCTLSGARRYFGRSLPNHQLHTVSAHCGYDLTQHHHALADARACAHIALALL